MRRSSAAKVQDGDANTEIDGVPVRKPMGRAETLTGDKLRRRQEEMKARLTGIKEDQAIDAEERLNRVIAYFEDLATYLLELLATHQKEMDAMLSKKFLLTPEETAASIGFTLKAFNLAPWRELIPMKKVGIKNRFRPEDVKLFVDNLNTTYPHLKSKVGRGRVA